MGYGRVTEGGTLVQLTGAAWPGCCASLCLQAKRDGCAACGSG